MLSPAVRFVLSFLTGLIVLGYLYAYLSVTYREQLVWLLELTALLSGGLASLFADGVTQIGDTITYQGFSVRVIDECTGLFEMVIYLVAVGAVRTSIRNKVLGLLIGLPVIFGFNVVRIWLLLVAGAWSFEVFDFLHLYLWQATLILLIGSVWISWLYLVVFREKKRSLAVSG
ncbi:MAG: hypothetical protein GY867_06160 [bacterium]|nr:hypothetical protein [bacterium]